LTTKLSTPNLSKKASTSVNQDTPKWDEALDNTQDVDSPRALDPSSVGLSDSEDSCTYQSYQALWSFFSRRVAIVSETEEETGENVEPAKKKEEWDLEVAPVPVMLN
jgi:hypothetical protein